jgi:hypothetical protein
MLLEEDEDDVEKDSEPRHISILTNGYLAAGLDDPGYSAFEAAFDTHIGDVEENGFLITDAVVRPLGTLNTPARTFSNWRVPAMKSVVAILADDIPAQEALLDLWGDFNVPFKVMIYSGDYLIEGTMFSDDDDPPEFYQQAFRPMEEAIITYLPDKKADVIHVKLGLVNVFHIHGFSIDEV